MIALADFMAKYNMKPKHWQHHLPFFKKIGWVLVGAYFCATIVSNIVKGVLVDAYVKAKREVPMAHSRPMANVTNYRDLKKAILERNIFNSKGELPPDDPVGRGDARYVFDMNAPCERPTTNIQLVGTIYLGRGGNSIATFRDPSYSEADVYRVGDDLIGLASAKIMAIEPNMVIVNNDGKKECFEIATIGSDFLNRVENGDGKPTAMLSQPRDTSANDPCGNILLDASYVEKELGTGLSNIIQKMRIVPNIEEGRISGFKVFNIDKSSLLGKLCLEENDVITRVNDVNMKESAAGDQGTALFMALQNEREVRVEVMRNNQPKQIVIRIK